MSERLGVLGGTFDPIHIGHLVAAVNVRHALHLDRVLMMVANDPWQKAGRALTPAAQRLAVAEAAVGHSPGLEVSRMEIDRGGPSYTADTVEELARDLPGAELFVIVGADVAADLGSWVRWETVARMATLVAVNRAGAPDAVVPVQWRVERVEIPALEVSSSDLRRRVAAGLPLDYVTPPAAIACIHRLGLYSGGT